ncbi:hypothetical protein S7335_4119 [Synechococcus sp. PCC 7335]|uniref:hypothetical protein n=1 Tax=Synechococcus sp. (strain ATCC 29403 / PCC 7335) TaxID=91464 RepID=UPI00017EBFA7|nr:hypothetical protein [Synechococcus sp. PCC 7335]EDX86415.1 hypothetical protein S7335_4119 [Synechococcus sp. PCC 7335]
MKEASNKVPGRKKVSYLVGIASIVSSIFQVQVARANLLEVPIVDIEVPEEILRTEIIVEARSPVTGELLTAAEYTQLQARLDREGRPPQLSSDIRQLVYLLRLRRLLKPIVPFIKEQQTTPSTTKRLNYELNYKQKPLTTRGVRTESGS